MALAVLKPNESPPDHCKYLNWIWEVIQQCDDGFCIGPLMSDHANILLQLAESFKLCKQIWENLMALAVLKPNETPPESSNVMMGSVGPLMSDHANILLELAESYQLCKQIWANPDGIGSHETKWVTFRPFHIIQFCRLIDVRPCQYFTAVAAESFELCKQIWAKPDGICSHETKWVASRPFLIIQFCRPIDVRPCQYFTAVAAESFELCKQIWAKPDGIGSDETKWVTSRPLQISI
jgi:hypothetical protein